MDPNAAPWLKTTLEWLQSNSGWLQAVAALLAVPATVIGAIWASSRGARLSYKLGEKSALEREARASAEERKAAAARKSSMRLLLSLEIQRNLDDLRWLRENLVNALGEEGARRREGAAGEDEKPAWSEARQRFVLLYMPDWSHRFWYGQQSSHLLPEALAPDEIRRLDFFHSQLDRLTKLKEMLAERAQGDTAAAQPPSGAAPVRPGDFAEEAPILWDDLSETIRELLDSPPTLAAQAPASEDERSLEDAPPPRALNSPR